MEKKYDVLLLTASTVDNIVEFEGGFPIPKGISRAVKNNYLEPGGEGNFIIEFTRLGGKILPVGLIGTDSLSAFLHEKFTEEGVDLSKMKVDKDYKPPIALCLIDGSGKHSFLSQVYASPLGNEYEKAILSLLKESKSYFLSGYYLMDKEHPYYGIALELVKEAVKLSIPIFFDPGPYVSKIEKDVLSYILRYSSLISFNEDEAKEITREDSAETALIKLSGIAENALSVVKIGKDGCIYKRKDSAVRKMGALDVQVVDTTGCGDTFLAALMWAKLYSYDDEEALLLANAVGSVMASKLGSGTNVPTVKEIIEILEINGYSVLKNTRENCFGSISRKK